MRAGCSCPACCNGRAERSWLGRSSDQGVASAEAVQPPAYLPCLLPPLLPPCCPALPSQTSQTPTQPLSQPYSQPYPPQLFRESLQAEDFIEIHTPKLLAGASEGGSAVFRFDYMGRPGCLAQSPQFYKQVGGWVGGGGRVMGDGLFQGPALPLPGAIAAVLQAGRVQALDGADARCWDGAFGGACAAATAAALLWRTPISTHTPLAHADGHLFGPGSRVRDRPCVPR